MRLIRLFGVICYTLSAVAVAAPTQPDTAAKMPVSNLGASSVLEMASVLTGVIILILALAWLFKRLGNFSPAGKGIVKILGGVSLGPRERAVVLEAGDKRLLVGIAPGRIQTLCMLNDSADTEKSSGDVADSDFSSQLDAQLQDEVK